jgi:hypothetical protein
LLGVGRHWWHNRDPELSCFNGRIRASWVLQDSLGVTPHIGKEADNIPC